MVSYTDPNDIKKLKKDLLIEKNKNANLMQIYPHISLLNKDIETLNDSLYDNTKKYLVLKAGLEHSKNYINDYSTDITKDFCKEMFYINDLFAKEKKRAEETKEYFGNEINRLKNEKFEISEEIYQCDLKIEDCEKKIGYQLLAKEERKRKVEQSGEEIKIEEPENYNNMEDKDNFESNDEHSEEYEHNEMDYNEEEMQDNNQD